MRVPAAVSDAAVHGAPSRQRTVRPDDGDSVRSSVCRLDKALHWSAARTKGPLARTGTDPQVRVGVPDVLDVLLPASSRAIRRSGGPARRLARLARLASLARRSLGAHTAGRGHATGSLDAAGLVRTCHHRQVPDDAIATVVHLPGGPIPYTLRHSTRSRSLRVVVHPERGVVVTVPATRAGRVDGERRAAEFLGQREGWVRRHLARFQADAATLAARGGARDGGSIPFRGRVLSIRVVPAVSGARRSTIIAFDDELVVHRASRDRRPEAAIVEAWLRDEARVAVAEALERHARAMGVTPAAVSFRDPRTRWGSASRQGRLSFSWRLVLAPPEALDTVVIHELAHLRVFGHGRSFWALVAAHRPDHRVWRRWLHDHSTELHGALGSG